MNEAVRLSHRRKHGSQGSAPSDSASEVNAPEAATGRHPRPGDQIYLYGDRRTVLAVRDGRVLAHDDAGFALSRRTDTLFWDGQAWRAYGDRA